MNKEIKIVMGSCSNKRRRKRRDPRIELMILPLTYCPIHNEIILKFSSNL